MIAESAQKVQQLDVEKLQEKELAQPKPVVKAPPMVEFPDNKNIDPYDPATFGYVEIGIVTGAHGVHGWIKVKSTTDFPKERLCDAGSIRHLKLPNKRAPRRVVLLQGKAAHQDEYLLQLDDIEDRDTAQKLRGAILYAREEEKVTPEQEEYLISDLVGLQVYLVEQDTSDAEASIRSTNHFVGTVGGIVFAEDLCSVPGLGHDMLEIVIPRGIGGTASLRDELVLVPMVPQIVPCVDIKGGAVYIDPPTGLLDLTYIRDEKVRIKGFLPPARD
jgi:16S rRNA processing protein RimM